MTGKARPAVDAIMREADIRFAYLFGSRAAGGAKAGSDADIAVMPSRSLRLLERADLAAKLVAATGFPDVDLVTLDEAGLELRGCVVQEGELIYSADERARVGFEVRTRSEYFDFLPTLRTMERAYLARVADRGL